MPSLLCLVARGIVNRLASWWAAPQPGGPWPVWPRWGPPAAVFLSYNLSSPHHQFPTGVGCCSSFNEIQRRIQIGNQVVESTYSSSPSCAVIPHTVHLPQLTSLMWSSYWASLIIIVPPLSLLRAASWPTSAPMPLSIHAANQSLVYTVATPWLSCLCMQPASRTIACCHAATPTPAPSPCYCGCAHLCMAPSPVVVGTPHARAAQSGLPSLASATYCPVPLWHRQFRRWSYRILHAMTKLEDNSNRELLPTSYG